MPAFAAEPVPTISAVGVASPSEHGQASTITATAAMTPAVKLPAINHQPRNATTATLTTTGTKIAATRSTKRCTGGFFACAFSTSAMMRDNVDCAPTAVVD